MGLSLEGLGEVGDFLQARCRELSYLSLTERPNRLREHRLGRFDFPESVDSETFDEDPTAAAMAWLEGQVQSNMRGERQGTFRVRCYFPKGHSSATFTLQATRDEGEELALELASDPMETEVYGHQELAGHQNRFVQQMLSQTEQFRNLVLGTVDKLEGHHQRRTDQYAQELTAARGQIHDLAKSISSQRIAHATANAERIASVARIEAEEQRQQHSQVLAQQAVGQIGQLVSLVAMQKSSGGSLLSPSQQALLSAVQSSPELQAALSQPEIQALLTDPANLEALAAMLRAAASTPNPEEQA